MGNVMETCGSSCGVDLMTLENKLDGHREQHDLKPEMPPGPAHRPVPTNLSKNDYSKDAYGSLGPSSRNKFPSAISPKAGTGKVSVLGNSGGLRDSVNSYEDDDDFWDDTTRYGGPLTDDETECPTLRTEADFSEGSRLWSSRNSSPTPRGDLKVSWAEDRTPNRRSSAPDVSQYKILNTHDSVRTSGSRHAIVPYSPRTTSPQDKEAAARQKMAKQSSRFLRKSNLAFSKMAQK